eukprot:2542540-Pyramimonas_sp.AAC.1
MQAGHIEIAELIANRDQVFFPQSYGMPEAYPVFDQGNQYYPGDHHYPGDPGGHHYSPGDPRSQHHYPGDFGGQRHSFSNGQGVPPHQGPHGCVSNCL